MLQWQPQAIEGPKLNITGTTSCVKFASDLSKAQRLRSTSILEPFSSASLVTYSAERSSDRRSSDPISSRSTPYNQLFTT